MKLLILFIFSVLAVGINQWWTYPPEYYQSPDPQVQSQPYIPFNFNDPGIPITQPPLNREPASLPMLESPPDKFLIFDRNQIVPQIKEPMSLNPNLK